MHSLQLFQEEELFLRFRPHVLSFLGHYAASFAWLFAGALGAVSTIVIADSFGPAYPSLWGLLVMATLGLAGGALRRKIRGGSMGYTWFSILAIMAVIVALFVLKLPDDQPWLPAVGLGLVLSLLRLVGWELMRIQRVHFLTSQRLVVRAGLGHRKEESVPLTKVQEVRSQLGPMGQLFDYGDLILGLGTVGRGKGTREDTWPLAGIGRLAEVKHQLEELMAELRMPIKERRRRVEERRLRESMRKLASWMRSDRSQMQSL